MRQLGRVVKKEEGGGGKSACAAQLLILFVCLSSFFLFLFFLRFLVQLVSMKLKANSSVGGCTRYVQLVFGVGRKNWHTSFYRYEIRYAPIVI